MIAFGIMAVGTALFMFTPETFMKMFTTQPSTITAGASALRIISCGFIVSSVSVVSSGALEGLGKGNESLAVSLLLLSHNHRATRICTKPILWCIWCMAFLLDY